MKDLAMNDSEKKHVSSDEMDEAIKRYETARDNGTLDEEFPVIAKVSAPVPQDSNSSEIPNGSQKEAWWKVWVEFTNHQRTSEEAFDFISQTRLSAKLEAIDRIKKIFHPKEDAGYIEDIERIRKDIISDSK